MAPTTRHLAPYVERMLDELSFCTRDSHIEQAAFFRNVIWPVLVVDMRQDFLV